METLEEPGGSTGALSLLSHPRHLPIFLATAKVTQASRKREIYLEQSLRGL
jgi:hypothetical protein